MSTLRFRHAAAFALLAPLIVVACSSSSDVISIGSYDTSCQKDADCTVVTVGVIGCCADPNGAINVSDLPKYEADVQAALGARPLCTADCEEATGIAAVCSRGTCGLATPGAGAQIACHTTLCTGGDICVESQPAATYRCAAPPAACDGVIDCGCAQALCGAGSTCQQAGTTLVQCLASAP
jgi:hypothetical protein